MRLLLCLPVLLTAAAPLAAQTEFVSARDPHEIRIPRATPAPDADSQRELREASAWPVFAAQQPGWRAVMDPATGLPHRAFGPGLDYAGADPLSRTEAWAAEVLPEFGIPSAQAWRLAPGAGRHVRVLADQTVDGIPVIGGSLLAKWDGDRLVAWGLDWYRDAALPAGTPLPIDALTDAAAAGLVLDSWSGTDVGPERLLPVALPDGGATYHLVRELTVNGRKGTSPRRYLTWVDVHSGEVLMRKNLIVHIDGGIAMPAESGRPERTVRRMGIDRPTPTPPAPAMVLPIDGMVRADVHVMFPFEAQETVAMPHLGLGFGNPELHTDDEGFFSSALSPGTSTISLEGRWSSVATAGAVPSVVVDWAEGTNDLVLNDLGNERERSAFYNVNRMHDHMKSWMPDFVELDEPLTTNIDVDGTCNAFWDGSSVNFYPAGGGCNPTSLIADVVWHEYGHGINGRFYQSQGGFFMNGAMNEGYADFWAMSLGDIAIIGQGFYTDNQDGIRRYDIDPKVYPQDLVGEVHADGEIICGAWYDTHLLMGQGWEATMQLFLDAYGGLQAMVADGDEGQAFSDVLLDALQADDDDADISNGTPNGGAIVEGFAIHGITLFSYAELDHAPVEFAPAATGLEIEGDVNIVFPASLYLDGVYLWYATEHGGPWTETPMTAAGGDSYVATIPAQDASTVVAYYMGVRDDFGYVSAVSPESANNPDYPNLPHFTLIGVEQVEAHDGDEFSDFGTFQEGVAGDGATTGQWEEVIPVGSYATPGDASTIVAPSMDHTDGIAGFCFVTGQSPGADAGIGANDVDAGHTTLRSPTIDLSSYTDPVLAYWRWFANAPASGANPASDWWQVQVSNNGGATWTYLENTLQQDISWRRMAFRVADVIEPTSQFRIQFIASDSTTVGEYLDGGSLIEAAVDDIIVYDIAGTSGVATTELLTAPSGFPNPARTHLQLTGWHPVSTLRILSATGALVHEVRTNASGEATLNVAHLAPGTYIAQGLNAAAQSAVWRFGVE